MKLEKLGITPGPWETNLWGITDSNVSKEKRRHIAFIPPDHERKQCNANLMAAAPEMLETLIEIGKDQELHEGGVDYIIKDAIELATGRTWEEVKELIDE